MAFEAFSRLLLAVLYLPVCRQPGITNAAKNQPVFLKKCGARLAELWKRRMSLLTCQRLRTNPELEADQITVFGVTHHILVETHACDKRACCWKFCWKCERVICARERRIATLFILCVVLEVLALSNRDVQSLCGRHKCALVMKADRHRMEDSCIDNSCL